MAFTTPRTWVTSELVSSSIGNTHWRDNFNAVARAYDHKVTATAVNTTTTETDLLNGEFAIPTEIGTGATVRITAWGDWINNSGGNVVLPAFTVRVAGTLFLNTGTPSTQANTSASRWPWELCVTIQELNSTSSQWIAIRGYVIHNTLAAGVAGATFSTGAGVYQQQALLNNAILHGAVLGTANVSGGAGFSLAVVNGSASASYETKLYGAVAEILP